MLGIFGSGLAYLAWYDALQNLTANQAGVFLYIEPLVAMLLALLVLDEPVTWASLLGGAIIILGVWLVNRKPQQPLRHLYSMILFRQDCLQVHDHG